ncbi:cytochrome P450 81E8-like [Syzygium oleosum]|uniref:cytochrome P450 81E8-like n=1 Tax=Syzygium oleosum TaxID=219896 RepID=UPI0011D2C662|nr:cytochrome P450 81E8-like [Syzygium oleosum]XP_056161096.1 cytochrome P450 81E8-like [Syzygium oleosum]
MADATLYVIIVSLLSLIILHSFLRRKPKNLPPGPPSLPIIGHLHLLKFPLHRSLYHLSNKYGPIMSLWFGSRRVVVVSSLPLAEECFTKNDIVLANRPKLFFGKHLAYDNSTLTNLPYGAEWRNLRKIATIEVLSTHRLNILSRIRRDEAERLMLRLVRNGFGDFHRVELKTLFMELTFNVIMRMISGKRYYGEGLSVDEAEAREFREIIEHIVGNGGTSYVGDFLPILNWIDYKGFKKMAAELGKRADAFIQGLVDEHKRRKGDPEFADSMISHLLRLQESQPENYSDLMIKALVIVMLVAGTDTSSLTLEWAMTNLLNNPEKLEKAQVEINSIIGHDRLLEESDVSKLPYLQCIIFETLRLSTTVPLLLPHESSADCTIGGYLVPCGTIVLVNAWASHRDPELWEEPTAFKPERFEGGNGENHRKLVLPFGLGRRACPGAPLAHRVMGLTLGLLIQCFDWKRVNKEKIDMTEGKGLTMPKVVPLELMCKVRPPMEKLVPKD